MEDIPEYLAAMVRREVPQGPPIVPPSIPVVSFGDYRKVRIATLGINPSDKEFVPVRRFVTATTVDSGAYPNLSDDDVRSILRACFDYFKTDKWYEQWFRPLDYIVSAAWGVSYLDGSLSHLDISQWATSTKWGQLSSAHRKLLLDDGVQHLQNQLKNEQIERVVINGSSVWNELERSHIGESSIEDVDVINFGKNKTSCILRKAVVDGTTFLGWSANIQSQPGANSFELRDCLIDWLKNH